MKSYLYKTKSTAEEVAKKEIGCDGAHKHKRGVWMPCSSHKEFLKKTKEKTGGEIEELIDFDGTMNSSKIPILDPALHPRKTTDQTVAATRITQDPLVRGYRTYYGESIDEEDMSGAFGYEETKDMDAEDTIEYLSKKMGLEKEDAKDRAEEMGKDENLDDTSEYKDDEDFIMKGRITEKQKILSKEEIEKMAEDVLLKKSEDGEITTKDKEISPILKRNIKALKHLANIEGISKKKLISLMKEQEEINYKEEYPDFDDFIDELSNYLSYDLSEDEVADYLEYWEEYGPLELYWSQGATPEETVNDLKDDKGRIFWYK